MLSLHRTIIDAVHLCLSPSISIHLYSSVMSNNCTDQPKYMKNDNISISTINIYKNIHICKTVGNQNLEILSISFFDFGWLLGPQKVKLLWWKRCICSLWMVHLNMASSMHCSKHTNEWHEWIEVPSSQTRVLPLKKDGFVKSRWRGSNWPSKSSGIKGFLSERFTTSYVHLLQACKFCIYMWRWRQRLAAKESSSVYCSVFVQLWI